MSGFPPNKQGFPPSKFEKTHFFPNLFGDITEIMYFCTRKCSIKHRDNIRPPMDAPTKEAHSLLKKRFRWQAAKSVQ